MREDFLSIGADRSCGRCGEEVMLHHIHGIEIEGDNGIGKGRGPQLEDILCRQCRYELEEWLYGDEYDPRNIVELTMTVRSPDQ